MYEHYKKARNKAWETLLKSGISSLPVDLGQIARVYGIKVILYSDVHLEHFFPGDALSGDGFILHKGLKKQIFLNDKIHSRPRRRFTLAHELGHGILNHTLCELHFRNSETNSQTDMQELEANIFARDILMPAVVLAALGVHTPEEIMELCDVSRQSAEIRSARMKELYQRGSFCRHSLEQQVLSNFEKFIENYKKM